MKIPDKEISTNNPFWIKSLQKVIAAKNPLGIFDIFMDFGAKNVWIKKNCQSIIGQKLNFKNSVFYAQVPPSLGPGWAFSKNEESTDRLDYNWQKVGNGGGMNLMVITVFENNRKSLIQHCERR